MRPCMRPWPWREADTRAQPYSYESDIWSFGLSVMCCALGRFPIATSGACSPPRRRHVCRAAHPLTSRGWRYDRGILGVAARAEGGAGAAAAGRRVFRRVLRLHRAGPCCPRYRMRRRAHSTPRPCAPQCLEKDAARRPTAQALLRHPFVAGCALGARSSVPDAVRAGAMLCAVRCPLCAVRYALCAVCCVLLAVAHAMPLLPPHVRPPQPSEGSATARSELEDTAEAVAEFLFRNHKRLQARNRRLGLHVTQTIPKLPTR